MPDAAEAVDLLRRELRPADVVLVKASRAAGLERSRSRYSAGADGVRGVLAAATVALIISLLGTPVAIRILVKRGYGQLIRDDGPTRTRPSAGRPRWAAR